MNCIRACFWTLSSLDSAVFIFLCSTSYKDNNTVTFWILKLLFREISGILKPGVRRAGVRPRQAEARPSVRPDVRPNGPARLTLCLARPNYSCQQRLLWDSRKFRDGHFQILDSEAALSDFEASVLEFWNWCLGFHNGSFNIPSVDFQKVVSEFRAVQKF